MIILIRQFFQCFNMKLLDKIKCFFTLHFKHGEKINIEYPIDWEHMSSEDFRNVCTILGQPHGRKETLFLCLCALAHIRPDNPIHYDPKAIKDNVAFIIGGNSYIISPKVIQEACSQLEFILDSVGLAPSPIARLDRKLYGVSFEQYYQADAYMLRYREDNNGMWLKETAKCLTNGAVRKLLPWQQKGLVIWWNGVKKYLMDKYPFVLQQGEGSLVDYTPADILQDLLGVMNDGKPQDNDKILKSDVHSVLYTLNKIYEKNAHK